MKAGNFIIKLISVAVVVGCIIFYQNVAVQRTRAAQENEAAVEEVNNYNEEIKRQIAEAERAARAEQEAEEETTEARGPYTDGAYEGEAFGYGGLIRVLVTIKGGYIDKIDVTDHSLLTAIITDKGIVYPPFDVNLRKTLLGE